MAAATMQRFADSPKRGLIVITLTCGLGLLTGAPAADDYFALRSQQAKLEESLKDARREVTQLPQLEQRAAATAQSLAELEKITVGDSKIDDFRSGIVELTRAAGCRLRRLELETPRRRNWREDDHPWKVVSTGNKKEPETPYTLRSQRVAVSISGTLAGVYDLLKGLQDTGKAAHVKTLSLRCAGEQRTEVLLDLDLMVFDLEKSVSAGM